MEATAAPLPDHQQRMIDWLDQFTGTEPLKRSFATMKFSPEETDRLRRTLDGTLRRKAGLDPARPMQPRRLRQLRFE